MPLPVYEVYAIRYATREARRTSHFVGGDPHDAPMPMDYFVWLIRNADRQFIVDAGFTADMAARRKRTYLRTPRAGLALLGVDAASATELIVTHLHYDHIGTYADFPHARFHLQDDEMRYASGRHMRHARFNHGYEADDVIGMVRLLYEGRVDFHAGDDEIAPGITLHRIGGHTAGLQSVRVHTRRGWVVLASDASHYYEHFESGRVFPTTYHLGEVLDGYARLIKLAETPEHVVPGHDPLVLARYPAPEHSLAGVVARLDVMPRA